MSDRSVSASPSVPCLRTYQQESLDRADAAFAEGARAVLVCLPTGAGKGLLAAWSARQAVERGQRVLFVVHRREFVLDLKERLHAPGKRAVVFCHRVAEARTLAADLNTAGIPAAMVHGEMAAAERTQILARWACGEVQVVTNVYVLTEGFDLPALEVCMLARGCGSAGLFLQMVGRVLRPSPATGKQRALLIDLCGVVHQHGLPTDARSFQLDGTPIVTDEELGPLSACALGGAISRAPVCLVCHPPGPRRAPDRARVEPAEMKRIVFYDRDATRQAYLEYHRQIQEQRGYKAGWVAHRFRERFGVWPDRALVAGNPGPSG